MGVEGERAINTFSREARTWQVFSHALALLLFFVTFSPLTWQVFSHSLALLFFL